MSIAQLDVESVRSRFTALRNPFLFFDGPSGTQMPDEVIAAIVKYLHEANANMGADFETSRRTTETYIAARAAAARFFSCSDREVIFGPNMTSLNFMLTRTLGRTLAAGDEIVSTKLDHDGNVSPWLELARDLDLTVRFADLTAEGTLDLDSLQALIGERTRVVSFPWAANSIGTKTDARAVTELAHASGALSWVDAVHYASHGPIDVAALGADVVLCSAYKFCGPHIGVAYARAELLESWRPYKVRPAPDEPLGFRFESGTPQYEALAGFSAAIDYLDSLGGFAGIVPHEEALGERFLAGLPEAYTLYGPAGMDGRVPTFAFNHSDLDAHDVAHGLIERGINAGAGNYYSPGVMESLGIESAVRVGITHYNTEQEVDRLLEALDEVAAHAS
ncbi:MAG TPA: cysteine desulfurase-like protein [Gaiellaceae bacterium]